MGNLVDVSEAGPGRFEPEPNDRSNWRFCPQGELATAPFRLREKDLSGHVIVVGQSGSGKSETLRTLAFQVAAYWGWRVIVLDGKNDPDMAAQLTDMARTLGRKYREFPRDGYNFWRGATADKVVRLVDLLQTESQRDAFAARAELTRAFDDFPGAIQSTELFQQAL